MIKTRISFYFTDVPDYEAWSSFKTLALINNKEPQDFLAEVLKKYIAGPAGKQLRTGTWLPPNELIPRLKSDYGIETIPQTLYNYKKAGHLDGLFGGGQRLIVYQLEGVAAKYKQIQK